MGRVTQEQVLMVYKGCPDGFLTTIEVAERLNVQEHAVRAAISWLVIGKHLICSSYKISRSTKRGDLYIVVAYKWSGLTQPIKHVRQKPEERSKDVGMDEHHSLEYYMRGWKFD